MVLLFGVMVESILVNGLMGNNKVKEFLLNQMGQVKKENGQMVRESDGMMFKKKDIDLIFNIYDLLLNYS